MTGDTSTDKTGDVKQSSIKYVQHVALNEKS